MDACGEILWHWRWRLGEWDRVRKFILGQRELKCIKIRHGTNCSASRPLPACCVTTALSHVNLMITQQHGSLLFYAMGHCVDFTFKLGLSPRPSS